MANIASVFHLSELRGIRNKIALKEAEIDEILTQARRESDRRVTLSGSRLSAKNELENTLIHLKAIRQKSFIGRDKITLERSSLQQEVYERKLNVLAASPPFVLKIEQALVIVARVHQPDNPESTETETRWRSSVIALMKDVSDGIDRFKRLPGRRLNAEDVREELGLAAAAALLLALHVNAWTTSRLLEELNRIWLRVVLVEARADPQLERLVAAWQSACNALDSLETSICDSARDEQKEWDAGVERMFDCRTRAGLRPTSNMDGQWKGLNEGLLQEELRHIEKKVAPTACPSQLAARYNRLLTKCADAGAWGTAVDAYRSIIARIPRPLGNGNKERAALLLPTLYRHLLRSAKNARPPCPYAAVLVLRDMRLRGQEPSVSDYNLVISAYARAAVTAASTSVPDSAANDEDRKNYRRDMQREACVTDRGLMDKREDRGDTSSPWEQERGVGTDGQTNAGDGAKAVARKAQPSNICLGSEIGDRETSSPTSNRLRKKQAGFLFAKEASMALRRDRPQTAGMGWRLALEVVEDMRARGVSPNDVTYQTLVECCRSARDGGPASVDVYTTLKEAGIPLRFCYQAGLKNAQSSERCSLECAADLGHD